MNYNVELVPLNELVTFPNHPYKVDINEDLRNLQHSIEERGIDEPLIVRRVNDKLQIISGHRRFLASKLANLQNIPVRIVDLDDDQAAIMLVDSNLHRRNVLHSELAFAYKMKFDALKHQGKVKDDLTMCPVGTKYNTDSAEHIARQEGTSRRQIYRYIHLTNLNKELLEYLDQGIISFNPAVELSYLKDDEQELLLDAIKDINEQTKRLANWGSDFLEISSKKDATTQKDVLILQYKNKNETQTTDLKAIEKRKTRTQILSSFLSLTKKDISRAESNLWQQCTQKDFLSHRTHVKRDTTIQNPIFKRI